MLLENYQIRAPQVIALAEENLTTLLTGGKAVKEVGEAFSILVPGDMRGLKVIQTNDELPVMLDFLRSSLKAEGREVSRVPEIAGFRKNLELLTRSFDGASKTNHVLSKVLNKVESSPAAKNDAIRIFSDLEIRQTLNSSAGWNFPLDHAPSWKEIILAHPEVSAALKPDFYLKTADDRIMYDLLKNGFKKPFPSVHANQIPDHFVSALHEAEKAKANLLEMHAKLPLFSRSLWSEGRFTRFLTENHDLQYLRQDWNHVLEFWKNLGVGEKFNARYPTPEDFWDSDESLIEIYQGLKK